MVNRGATDATQLLKLSQSNLNQKGPQSITSFLAVVKRSNYGNCLRCTILIVRPRQTGRSCKPSFRISLTVKLLSPLPTRPVPKLSSCILPQFMHLL
eukprot:g19158.t1